MGSFYSPYYFVPVAKADRSGDLDVARLRDKRSPSDQELGGMRHDRFEADKHSGTISCSVTARSPIFIGDERNEETGVVEGFKLDDNPALPASSLRGLVSSMAETASNSALRVLSRKVSKQECYSFRKPMTQSLSAVGQLKKNGEQWFIVPLCLPTLNYSEDGRLEQSHTKWKRVFPTGPVFKLYTGDTQRIGNEIKREIAEEPPYGTWALRTGFTHHETITPLSWNDIDPLVPGSAADAALNIKGNTKKMVVAQRIAAPGLGGVIPVMVLARVLGCYEPGRKDHIPKTKKHEILLPLMNHLNPRLGVPNEVIVRFQQLADQMTVDSEGEDSPRPYEPKDTRPERTSKQRLEPQHGDLVFFDVDASGRIVTEIAYSSIWRGRVEVDPKTPANAWSFFKGVDPELLPFNSERTKITLAERVFGFVEEKTKDDNKEDLHWRGRVQFSHGISAAPIQGMNVVPLRELSGPKPPSPAMYFRKQTGTNQFIGKSDLRPGLHWPQGRKFYLHHRGAIDGNSRPWEGSLADFEPKRHVKISPWPKGSMWTFTITFENLSGLELGMMLYSLKPADGFLHKLGMGKPLGLGSVEIGIENVQIVDRLKRYSADGWDEPRFNGGVFDWGKLRDGFRNGMNPSIRAALEKIGDPQAVPQGASICYPLCTNADVQGPGKHYEWFVANEERARGRGGPPAEALQPVVTAAPDNRVQATIQPLHKLPPPHKH